MRQSRIKTEKKDAITVKEEDKTTTPISFAETYATSGPLTQLFRNSTARILDQSLIVGEMEQTISILAESTNLSYKTAASEIRRLVDQGHMVEGRKIGNARTFSFKVTNHLSSLIACAEQMQFERQRKEHAEAEK